MRRSRRCEAVRSVAASCCSPEPSAAIRQAREARVAAQKAVAARAAPRQQIVQAATRDGRCRSPVGIEIGTHDSSIKLKDQRQDRRTDLARFLARRGECAQSTERTDFGTSASCFHRFEQRADCDDAEHRPAGVKNCVGRRWPTVPRLGAALPHGSLRAGGESSFQGLTRDHPRATMPVASGGESFMLHFIDVGPCPFASSGPGGGGDDDRWFAGPAAPRARDDLHRDPRGGRLHAAVRPLGKGLVARRPGTRGIHD